MKFSKSAILFSTFLSALSLFGTSYQSYSIYLETGYDNNPALLTEEEKSAFENGSPKFMNIESWDDLYARLGGSASIEFRFKRGRRLNIGLGGFYTHNAFNEKNNYLYLKPFCEYRTREWVFGSAYTFIPRFAVRPYNDLDEPNSPAIWATYKMHRGSVDVRKKFLDKYWLCFEGEIESDIYNDNFPEYDGLSWQAGPAIRWSGPIYVKIRYNYGEYYARGYDENGETKLDSDETDISYVEDLIDGYVSWRFDLLEKRWTLALSYAFSRKFFTSEKPFSVDYIHIGRRDLRLDLGPSIDCKLTDSFTARANFNYTSKASDSPYYDLEPTKSYDRYRISLRGEYNF